MMKPLLLFALLILMPSPNIRAQSKPAPKLGVVTAQSRLDGCGCSVYRTADDHKNNRFLFVSDMDREAVIHLDGQDVKLRVLSWREKKGQLRVGERSSETYASGDVRVRLDFTVRRLCPPKDESCEATWYNVKMSVTRGRQRTTVNAKGVCGC
jgi:hypothetical protein